MITLGIAIFIAFVAGSVAKVVLRFYNINKEDPRPFNWDYIRPIIASIITVFPVIIANFLGWAPPLEGDHLTMVILAFMGGYGTGSGYKGIMEAVGLINKALNKAGELDDSLGSS